MTLHNVTTALITGASRGLGLALARALAARGWRLIVDARSAEALEQARAELARYTYVIAIPGDVTDAIAAPVREAAHIYLVDDGRAPPRAGLCVDLGHKNPFPWVGGRNDRGA